MDVEKTAIERLRMASDMSLRLYKQPLVITYSGGKDSDVLLHLAGKAGIPYEVLHSLTTADAPETVYHVKNTFRKLENGGGKMHHRYPPHIGRRECDHVEFDSAQTHAADTAGAVLLRGAQRDRRAWAVDRDRRSLGRIAKAQVPRHLGGHAQGQIQAADADERQ